MLWMTIELTREQEKLIRGFVDSGRYESVEAFLDEAITEAYTRTEAFKKLAREKLAAQKDFAVKLEVIWDVVENHLDDLEARVVKLLEALPK
jgi:Arc/MetJ-type ribon-helix-helix transcriptional regulator